MNDPIYEFFRNHIKMAMYGMRCDIWSNLELPIDDVVSIKEELKPIVDELKKVDTIIEKVITSINDVDAPEGAFSMDAFDAYRRSIDVVIASVRNDIDAIMCTELMSKRLFDVAMRRRQEQERQAQIANAKNAVNPANIAGSPESLGGATAVKIEKKDDGTAEITPVTEG